MPEPLAVDITIESVGPYSVNTTVESVGPQSVDVTVQDVGPHSAVIAVQNTEPQAIEIAAPNSAPQNVEITLGYPADPRTFPTPAALLASTRSAGGAGTEWRGGAYFYEEAASGASDYHTTTAGGVKLYVTPSVDGSMPVRAFGSGLTQDEITACIAASEGRVVDFGDGNSYTSNVPILVGEGCGKANIAGIKGKSTITFTYDQNSTTQGFGNPEKKQSGIHCWADPANERTIAIEDLVLVYTGTFDYGTNLGRVNGIFVYGYQAGKVENVSARGFNACGCFIGGSGAKSGGGNYDTTDTANISVIGGNFSGNRVAGVETAYTDNVRTVFATMNANGLSGDTGTGYGFATQSGTQVSNLKVIACTANGNWRKGIDTHAVNGATICENDCNNNFLWGIFVSGDSKGSVIVGKNRVIGMTASTTGSRTPVYGIYVGQDAATTSPAYLNASITDNHVEVSQESGAVAYPLVCRNGGDNRFLVHKNVFDCGTITHFILCDDAGAGTCSLYANDNVMMAASVASYYARVYKENLLHLDFCGNTIIHAGSYFQSEAINFNTAGTAPAAAARSTRRVENNKIDATAAGSVTGFINAEAGGSQAKNYINGVPFIPRPTYTIASGVVTVGDVAHALIATEGAASTDDLDTISGGYANQIIHLSAASSSNDVVLKDGTGNLRLAGDFTLTNGQDSIMLRYLSSGGGWLEVSRSDNTA